MSEPEEQLFQAVITRAYMDAQSQAFNLSALREKENSINWFLQEGADFRFVCGLAGTDISYIREASRTCLLKERAKVNEANKVIASHLRWATVGKKGLGAVLVKKRNLFVNAAVKRITKPSKGSKYGKICL